VRKTTGFAALDHVHRFFRENPMEAERTNAIRSQLADLTTRVVELRRYL
jgi:hypothetical protein